MLSSTGLPISQHVGANRYLFEDVLPEDPTPYKGIMQSLPPIFMAENIADWCVQRRPRAVAGTAGGARRGGHRVDPRTTSSVLTPWSTNHGWDTFPDKPITEKPSFYWRRNMAATFEQDLIGVRNRYDIGIENLMWATDYPHPDSTWPRSQEVLRGALRGRSGR